MSLYTRTFNTKAFLILIVLILGVLSTIPYTPRILAIDTELECYDLIQNGDLKAFHGWEFGETSYIASIVQEDAYNGVGSMRLGIPSGITNRLSHSTAYQHISLPDRIHSIEINYWRQAEGMADGIDYREVLILAQDFSTVITNVERNFAGGAAEWVEIKQDLTTQLSSYASQDIVLYANVYNNGQGTQMSQYLDDISLTVCVDKSKIPTPEPAHLPIATPEPDVTLEFPIKQVDITIQLGNGVTALGSDQEVLIPIELLNIPSHHSIGLVALELIYDWSTLRAMGCSEDIAPQINGLICNSEEPGIVRITMISDEGISENVQLTALSFISLAQPAQEQLDHSRLDLTIPLFQNTEGRSLDIKPISGGIILQCLRGDVNCDGQLNQADSLAIFQYDTNMQITEQAQNSSTGLPEFFGLACDTDSSGSCNAIDGLFISQCIMGIDNVFCPAESPDELRGISSPSSSLLKIERASSAGSSIITLPVTVNLPEEDSEYALGAATIDWRYDPAIVKAIRCTENPNNDFDDVVCHLNGEKNEKGLAEISFTAVSNVGVAGLRTVVDVTFEVLTEADPADLHGMFEVEVRTFVDQAGQPLPYSIEGIGQQQIYLPLIQR